MIAERLRQLEERGLVSRMSATRRRYRLSMPLPNWGRRRSGFLGSVKTWSESLPAEGLETELCTQMLLRKQNRLDSSDPIAHLSAMSKSTCATFVYFYYVTDIPAAA